MDLEFFTELGTNFLKVGSRILNFLNYDIFGNPLYYYLIGGGIVGFLAYRIIRSMTI